jgi:hypothetical protein
MADDLEQERNRKAAEARGTAIARVLKAHRIRRFNAAEALRILRDKPLAVAPARSRRRPPTSAPSPSESGW